ncbi:heme biosynthesis HemY N-terminal domain-containing protein [Stappia sp.]|uniref:heme biosynthesis protein HemY n=1 Tax=Stappia sp. TaxID=1870903 RepID=UPI0032D96BA5
MIRLLIFIALVFVVALGSAWIADRPGVITLDWQGYRIETGLMPALVALALLLAAGIVLWNLALYILRSPGLFGRFLRRRRKDRGYDAMSKAMLALGVGDAGSAARHGREASKLLAREPATELLLAQSAQLAGRHDEARERFEAMLEDPALKPVGLHGLYIEAERLNEPVAARHYAQEAMKLVPGLDWAGRAVLGYQAVAGDWAAAIRTLERNYASKLIDKKTFRRHKAVLLTAQAQELEDRDPDSARQKANEAHGLAPGLVPAAVLAARLATRRGDIRKAMKVVEATWKEVPHPDLADAYAHARNGDSAQDRLKRVKALAALRAHNAEGALAVARAAMETGDWELARAQMKSVMRQEPTRRAFLLMADLEERQHGDRGRVREWLARAVRAPADPAWVADGVVAESWAPVSPVDGRLDAFRWTTPPEAIDHNDTSLEALDDTLLDALPTMPEPADDPDAEVKTLEMTAEPPRATAGEGTQTAEVAADAEVDAGDAAEGATTTKDGAASPTAKAEPAQAPDAAKETAGGAGPAAASAAPEKAEGSGTVEKPASETAQKKDGSQRAQASGSPAPAQAQSAKPEGATPAGPGATKAGDKPDLSKPIEFPLKHMPDDPGPDDDDASETVKKPGYRFFN